MECISHEQAAPIRARPEFREWRERLREQETERAQAARRARGYERGFPEHRHTDRIAGEAERLEAGYDAERRRYQQATNRAARELYGQGKVAVDMADPYGED